MNLFVKDRSFYKTMIKIAIPMSLQQMIVFGVNLMDTVMVGRFGEVALSATSLANSWFMIINVMTMGLSCGGGVIISQYWGKKDLPIIRDTCSICLKLALIISILATGITMAFPAFIMSIYTSDADVITEGAKYIRILGISFLFFCLTTATTQNYRAVGQVKIPLYATIGSFFVNIFFNYILIFGKLGCPRLELVGAAWGTVIARFFEFCVIFGSFIFRDKVIGFRFKHFFSWNSEIFKKYLKIGLPVLFSDLIMIVGSNLVTIIIGHVGSVFVAANSIATMVNNFITNIFFGVSNSSSILTGNAVGSGEYKKAYDQGVTYLTVGFLFGIVGGLFLFAIKSPVISLFNVQENTIVYAKQILNVLSCIMPINILDHILTKGVLRGGGDTKFLIIGDTVFTYFVAVPLGYLAAYVLGLPIWLTYGLLRSDALCKCILCLWRFLSKKWIRDVTKKGTEKVSI